MYPRLLFLEKWNIPSINHFTNVSKYTQPVFLLINLFVLKYWHATFFIQAWTPAQRAGVMVALRGWGWHRRSPRAGFAHPSVGDLTPHNRGGFTAAYGRTSPVARSAAALPRYIHRPFGLLFARL